LAVEAFERVAVYDAAIVSHFAKTLEGDPDDSAMPYVLVPAFRERLSLRYGENPHQVAKFYDEPGVNRPCIGTAEQLHGKELSYNNILDLDSALNLVREFTAPTCIVVKHNNPCGAASAATLADAFRAAWAGDPQSAFGGILAFNKPVDADTASAIMDPTAKRFIECVIAPDYDPHALDALKKWKENVRLLRTGELVGGPQGLDYRRVDGGLLVQTRDVGADDPDKWKVVTKREPSESEFLSLHFAWFVCKHVKSNAIVLVSPQREQGNVSLVGVGAGQMSRVDSVEIPANGVADLSWPPTRFSRSATTSIWRRKPESRRSCSPAAPSATPIRSLPVTRTTSRCCSPACGISGIDAKWQLEDRDGEIN
jgi:phosphoribosylaminoimidazolecarboxamide formyltransferase/IMP cyclohydrolase